MTQPNPYAPYSEEQFRSEMETIDWFHAIDFGAFQSRGRFAKGVQNKTLLGVLEMLNGLDLKGRDCLDIGTVDGLTAFGMKAKGARRVVATDRVENRSFLLSRAKLGLDIEYHTGLELARMVSALEGQRFDVVICAGVIYHMINPTSAFTTCRQLVKPGGFLIMESALLPSEKRPVMLFNPEAELLPERQTYWIPSRSAVDGQMRFSGFSCIASRTLINPERYAVLGQAVPLNEIKDRGQLLAIMHERGYTDYEFDILTVDKGAQPTSMSYSGESGHKEIGSEYQVNFPFHPQTLTNPVGVRHWEEIQLSKT